MGWTDTSVCLTHPTYETSAAAQKPLLKAAGVERAWVYSYGVVRTHDFQKANQQVLAAAEADPEFIVPLALVNPFTAGAEIDALLQKGFKGVKILSGWGNWLTIDNIRTNVAPVARKLAAQGLHLSIALEGNSPLRGGSVYLPLLVREACPEIALVLDHCRSPDAWLDYLTIAEEDETLWFTLHDLPSDLIRKIVDRIGLGRLVIGSWFPESAPDAIFERVRHALNIHSDRLAVTMTRNAQRILQGHHANYL
jgi:hypothetical protein